MKDLTNPKLKEYLFGGSFGLERETLRVTGEGFMAQTPHPFPDNAYIVKDFCENQTEINTGVYSTAEGVIGELKAQTELLYRELAERGEYLWLYSNPPYILNDDDIPIARYEGEQKGKQSYRVYLAEKYGKYKMTLSGIHVNYSFSEELLNAAFAVSGRTDFITYQNSVYLHLAEALTAYGWILNLLLSASPVRDGSYRHPSCIGEDDITGDASVRCSFHGYWNHFTPVFDYTDILAYAESIQEYISSGCLSSASELYYPIRLKPRGSNRLNALVQTGVNHIELRNIDLNPYAREGIDERDLRFIELLLLYLTAKDEEHLSPQEQYFAIQNFKNAARYDIDTETIRLRSGVTVPARDAGLRLLSQMKAFYSQKPLFDDAVRDSADSLLEYQVRKLTVPGTRYAERVTRDFSGGYMPKMLTHVKKTAPYALQKK